MPPRNPFDAMSGTPRSSQPVTAWMGEVSEAPATPDDTLVVTSRELDAGVSAITVRGWSSAQYASGAALLPVVGDTVVFSFNAEGEAWCVSWEPVEWPADPGVSGGGGGSSLTHRGTWLAATAYVVNDSVVHLGSSYRRLITGTTATVPASDPTNWELYAAKGDTGAAGSAGATGAAGAAGATGAKGAQWRGAWSAVTAYVIDDVVGLNGASWICILGHTNHAPPNATYWGLVADKGATGSTGGAFTQTIGDGAATTFTVTHGLGTKAVIVGVREVATGIPVWAGHSATTPTTNTVEVAFATAPSSSQFEVVVMSGAGPTGATGATGPGVATGGTAGQFLRKVSGTNYDTAWAAIAQSEVTSLVSDLALKAPLASPTFTGTPTLPTGTIATTQTAGDATTKLATTAFVTAADSLKANLVSPTFTGAPLVPTATGGTNTTQAASTAFVQAAIAPYLTTAIAASTYATIASPAFTGAPSLPTGTTGVTQAAGDSSTKLATTAFVAAADALKANLASPTFTGTVTVPNVAIGVGTSAATIGAVNTALGAYLTTSAAASAYQPLDSDLTTIAGLTATTDNIMQAKAGAWSSRTPAQVKTDLALTKTDVGLANVDNTSDINKPVSTAQAAADAAASTADRARANHTGTQTASTVSDFTTATQAVAVGGDVTGTVSNIQYGAGSIVNADVSGSAAIALSKLATDPLDRANHTGSQAATTVSVDSTTLVGVGTNVQAVLEELDDAVAALAAGSGIPASTVDAKGDLIVATANDTVARVAVGADGCDLRADSSQAAGVAWTPWGVPYMASMYVANSGAPTHTSNGGWQKVGSGGGTVTWTSEYDKRPPGASAQVDTATNKRIDIRKTGVYIVTAAVELSSISAAKLVAVAAYKNGAAALQSRITTGAAFPSGAHLSAPLVLTSGDYLELYAYQNDSASEAYDTAVASYNRLTVTYLGPST